MARAAQLAARTVITDGQRAVVGPVEALCVADPADEDGGAGIRIVRGH